MDIEIDSLNLPEFGLTHKAGNYADLAYRSLALSIVSMSCYLKM